MWAKSIAIMRPNHSLMPSTRITGVEKALSKKLAQNLEVKHIFTLTFSLSLS